MHQTPLETVYPGGPNGSTAKIDLSNNGDQGYMPSCQEAKDFDKQSLSGVLPEPRRSFS